MELALKTNKRKNKGPSYKKNIIKKPIVEGGVCFNNKGRHVKNKPNIFKRQNQINFK